MIEDDVLIIDGQQRITTVSIIVIALYNAVKNNKIISIRPEIIERRISPYLYAEFKTVKRNIKLKPIERDIEAYDALFSNDIKNFVSGSGITNNYEFFYEQILRSGLSFEDIFESLEKLVIIDLRLESSDNPQLIFESLNSTGKILLKQIRFVIIYLCLLIGNSKMIIIINIGQKLRRIQIMTQACLFAII
jgi:uncharacterized protein with ParB-like and HNH nuclease domain